MRFIDRLRAEGPKLDVFRHGHGKTVMDLLSRATVMVADNVSEYFFAQNTKEVWHVEDFPNIAPPFELCFIEMRKPSAINSIEHGHVEWDTMHRPTQWGILFQAATVTPDVAEIVTRDLPDYGHQKLVRYALEGVRDVANAGGGWFVSATLIWDAPQHGIEPAWSWGYGVNLQGKPVPMSSLPENKFGHVSCPNGSMAEIIDMVAGMRGSLMVQTDINSAPAPVTPESLASELLNLLKPALLAITFLHCKNVEKVHNSPDAALSKKHMKRGRPALSRFYTLRINAMGGRGTRKAGMPGSSSIEQSLHIVRGHFKTFTAEQPLFGRWVGTYWWEWHTAGSRTVGTVEKDYKVTAPRPSPP